MRQINLATEKTAVCKNSTDRCCLITHPAARVRLISLFGRSKMLFEVKPYEKIPSRSLGVVWLKDSPLSKASEELISYFDDNKISEI